MSEQLYPKPKKKSFLDSLRPWEVEFVRKSHFTGDVTWKRSYFTEIGASFSVRRAAKFGKEPFDEARLKCYLLPYL